MQFAMFPSDTAESKSEQVSKIIEMIRDKGIPYKLNAMSTIVETETMNEALEILNSAYEVLEKNHSRVYSTVTFDIRKNKKNRMDGKVESIESKIGSVNK